MKTNADQKRKDLHFELGEFVYLKLQPYRLRSLARRINEKLSPKFYEPYKILKKIEAVAYRIELLPIARIHNVFHISQLKKVTFSPSNIQPLPRLLDEDMVLVVEPVEVLKFMHLINRTYEVLIKWKGLPGCENTWEDFDLINQQITSFHLEDEVVLLREGNDETREIRVYGRKKK